MDAKRLLTTLALGAGLFARLGAQQPTPMMAVPMGHAMGDPMALQDVMGPMMQVLLYMPEHLLARKDALGLTNDQVARLGTMRNAVQASQDAAMAQARGHVQAMLRAVAGPTPDTLALKTHFEAAHAAMGKAHWLALASAVQAKAVLTDAQRAKLETWADSLQASMEQHRQMMKPQPPHKP
jgi:hypothetical protein